MWKTLLLALALVGCADPYGDAKKADTIDAWESFLATEPSGTAHLRREGKPDSAIHDVGHVMVDNLLYQRDKLGAADKTGMETEAVKARYPKYGVVTLHRPSNVDDEATLRGIAGALRQIAANEHHPLQGDAIRCLGEIGRGQAHLASLLAAHLRDSATAPDAAFAGVQPSTSSIAIRKFFICPP